MRITLGQILSTHDTTANLEKVRECARQAAAHDASVLLLPEATMYAFGRSLQEVAEPLDGPWATGISQIAQDAGVAIVAGMFTPGTQEHVRNTAVVALADGAVHGYDKMHLYDAFGFKESDTVTPGDSPLLVTIDGVRVGVATCYDIRFPRLFTRLASEGAQVILLGASWGDGPGKAQQWELLARARALDSTSFVVAVDQADPASEGHQVSGSAPLGVGYSLVASPDGSVVDQLGAGVECRTVELDLDLVAKTRKAVPVLENTLEL